MSNYTYTQFAQEAIALAEGKITEPAMPAEFISKANALIAQQEKRKAYAAEHKAERKSESKASEETIERANLIAQFLTATPQTAAELNAAMGKQYLPLEFRQAANQIKGVKIEKQTRKIAEGKTRSYTTYAI